jgi:adenine-specific DNA-methyltransferase
MVAQGSFTDFLFPHNERLFAHASIDVVVFRYQKGLRTQSVQVNGVPKTCVVSDGIVTFSDTAVPGTPLQDLFDIYVGLVSARDSVFKSPLGRHTILCDKDTTETFILETTFPTPDPAINAHLLAHKQELLDRKIRTFTESNWFEWGAPRNRAAMESNLGKPCIYVRNVTRKEQVAWKGTVQYFGGSLLCMIPRTENVGLDRIVAVLNSAETRQNYTYSGRFKIGHKQLCNVRA